MLRKHSSITGLPQTLFSLEIDGGYYQVTFHLLTKKQVI